MIFEMNDLTFSYLLDVFVDMLKSAIDLKENKVILIAKGPRKQMLEGRARAMPQTCSKSWRFEVEVIK